MAGEAGGSTSRLAAQSEARPSPARWPARAGSPLPARWPVASGDRLEEDEEKKKRKRKRKTVNEKNK